MPTQPMGCCRMRSTKNVTFVNNNNNNNFIYTPDSEVKLRSVVLTYTARRREFKNVNTFINDLYYSKSDRVYHLKKNIYNNTNNNKINKNK